MTTTRASDSLGYFETIRACFTELTRRAIFLSGRDLELLARWRDKGATAAAVCKGLREAIEAMPDDDPPRDVYACRHYIEPYVERASRRGVGGHDGDQADEEPAGDGAASPSTGDGLLDRALARIERAGRACDDERLTRLYRRAWRKIRTDLDGDDDRLERLAAIEQGLADGYYRILDRDSQSEIASRIDRDSGELLERMSPEARREHLRARRRRILMEEFDLISLLD